MTALYLFVSYYTMYLKSLSSNSNKPCNPMNEEHLRGLVHRRNGRGVFISTFSLRSCISVSNFVVPHIVGLRVIDSSQCAIGLRSHADQQVHFAIRLNSGFFLLVSIALLSCAPRCSLQLLDASMKFSSALPFQQQVRLAYDI